ncbi:MAG: hypothetical protein ABIE03_03840 [Patescibacteria group bacterium]|nr:hypothetical protein [Patescibacteria group bacterium]
MLSADSPEQRTFGERLERWTFNNIGRVYHTESGQVFGTKDYMKRLQRLVRKGKATRLELFDYYTGCGLFVLLGLLTVSKLTKRIPIPKVPELRKNHRAEKVTRSPIPLQRSNDPVKIATPAHQRLDHGMTHIEAVQEFVNNGTLYLALTQAAENLTRTDFLEITSVSQAIVSNTPRETLRDVAETQGISLSKLDIEYAQLMSITVHMAAYNIIELDRARLPDIVAVCIDKVVRTERHSALKRAVIRSFSRQLVVAVGYTNVVAARQVKDKAAPQERQVASREVRLSADQARMQFRDRIAHMIEEEDIELEDEDTLTEYFCKLVTNAETLDDISWFLKEFQAYVPHREEPAPAKATNDRTFSLIELIAVIEESSINPSRGRLALYQNLFGLALHSFFEQYGDARQRGLYQNQTPHKMAMRTPERYGDGRWRKDANHSRILYVAYIHTPLPIDGKFAWPFAVFQKKSGVRSKGESFFPL